MRRCQLYEDLRQVVSQRCRNAILNFNPLAQWPSQGLSGLFFRVPSVRSSSGPGSPKQPPGAHLGMGEGTCKLPRPWLWLGL